MDDIFKQLGGVEVKSAEPTTAIPSTVSPQKPSAVDSTDIFAQLGAVEIPIAKQLLKENNSGEVTDEEVTRIGLQNQLSPEEIKELKGLKEYYGSVPDDPENLTDIDLGKLTKATAGLFSRSVLLNLPQFIYKKSQDNPNYRKAIDDLQEVGTGRQGWLIKGTEIGAGIAGALALGKGAAKLGGKLAKAYEPASAVAGGAAQSLATSREDEEVKDAATGAALGGAIFGGVYGAGKIAQGLYRGMKGLSGDYMEKSVKELEEQAPKIEQYIEEAVQKERPKLDAAKSVLLKDPDSVRSLPVFLTKVDPATIETLAPKSEVRKLFQDTAKLDALAEALDKPRSSLSMQEIKGMIALDSVSNLKNITTKFSGKSQTFEEILKESSQFADNTIERAYKISKVDNAVTDLKIRRQLSQYNPLQKAAIFISDGKFAAKVFDDKLGLKGALSLERTLDEGAIALNRYTDMLKEPLTESYRLAKKARQSGEDLTKVYDELDSGEITSETAKEFKTLFDNLREYAIKADVYIDKRENYVPKLRKTFVDYRMAFKKEADKLAEKINKPLIEISPEEYASLKKNDPQFKAIDNELAQLNGSPITDVNDFKFFLNKIETKPAEMKSGLETVAVATKARTGEIPDWALEKDVPTLAARWVQGTFRHRALRDTIQNLRAISKVADKSGQDYIAKYIRNLTADVMGKRRGTLNAFGGDLADNLKMTMMKRAEATSSPIAKKLYTGMADLPNIVTKIQSQVYPNYLGYNPKSALQNLTSFYFQNMPEIGPVLGTRLAIESIADLAKAKASGVNLTEMIIQEGILPRQWSGEMVEAVREGIKSGPIRDLSRKSLDVMTNTAMALFTKSEVMARANTLFMAKRLGNYMAKNPSKANKLLANMSSGTYRNTVREAIARGDISKAQSELNKYMQSTNMFNYDRLNMSEYGRVMGPLFSIFSKWPTATAGKLAHYYLTGGAKEGTVRTLKVLMMPMMVATLADQFLLEDQTPVGKKILGAKGLKGWTQLDSIPTDTGVRDGLLSTPIAATTMDFLDAIGDDKNKVKAIKKWVNNSFRSFFPGAGTLRFLAEDVPTYMTGKKQPKVNPLPE